MFRTTSLQERKRFYSGEKKHLWYVNPNCFWNRKPKGILDANHRCHLYVWIWEDIICRLRNTTVYIQNIMDYNFFQIFLAPMFNPKLQFWELQVSQLHLGVSDRHERNHHQWEQSCEFTRWSIPGHPDWFLWRMTALWMRGEQRDHLSWQQQGIWHCFSWQSSIQVRIVQSGWMDSQLGGSCGHRMEVRDPALPGAAHKGALQGVCV